MWLATCLRPGGKALSTIAYRSPMFYNGLFKIPAVDSLIRLYLKGTYAKFRTHAKINDHQTLEFSNADASFVFTTIVCFKPRQPYDGSRLEQRVVNSEGVIVTQVPFLIVRRVF